MENVLKKPYEISIWEDFTPSEDKKFYQERKIAIIGSNTMTSLSRAIDPKFVENVNGTHTLDFTLYTRFFDEEEGEFKENPYIPYMVNERKVKLNYDGEWYDFIIKEIDESSNERSYSYHLIDSYINELSKNGFNIELDTELENNQGTIKELATTILKDTDWKVGEVDTLVQKNIEALYAVKIPFGTSIKAIDMSTLINSVPTEITITSEQIIGTELQKVVYVFYSSAIDNTIPVQFLYREDGNYTLDEDGIINNASNYILSEGEIIVDQELTALDDRRGKRIVQKEITKYDTLTNHFIIVYEDNNEEELYMFQENEYISPTTVHNLIAPSKNFVSTDGWSAPAGLELKNTIYPSLYNYDQLPSDPSAFIPYMRMRFNSTKPILNTGLQSNITLLTKGIAQGEEFVFKVKYGVSTNKDGEPLIDTTNSLRLKVAKYTSTTDNFGISSEIISFTDEPFKIEYIEGEDLPYIYYKASANSAISYSDLKGNKTSIGIFFVANAGNSDKYYFVEDAQLFNYKLDQDNNLVLPEIMPNSCVKIKYNYYYPSDNTSAKTIDDIEFAYVGNEKPIEYKVKYDKTFEKIRSITAKESNRFNLIQSLCETFECWPRFYIEHNEDGSIKMDAINGLHKTISFKEYIGKENYSGFRYGINLDSIKRSLDSDQIVSKIIVKPNSNEYGIDGYCSIARAKENPIKENFLLNFNYYIQQGLLDGNEVNNDLYLYIEDGKYLGYYVQLNKLNKRYDDLINEYSLIETELLDLNATYTAFKTAYDTAITEINSKMAIIQDYCGVSYTTLLANKTLYERYIGNTEIQDLITAIQSLQVSAAEHKLMYETKQTQITTYEARLATIEETWEEVLKEKDKLNLKFYQKYSKYIQEGSWISEDYMDDNLYYLDAENVLNTSAFPEVSYTINVLELSQLEDYQNYSFNIGDKTYIEDVEFFGYKYIDGIKTPYQEEVILSEITYNLDSPESNQIKIQNYKTQFEDLFQRINAVSQTLQFANGSYNKVTNSFNTDGSIKQSAIQNSMINNSLILSNATDQSVRWDETGITITNYANPNEIVRLVSGGVMITADGGEHWSAGITGAGINTNYLTAGQIDASRINITTGGFPNFRWDSRGLNAYWWDDNGFDFNRFTRFDRFGLYGINRFTDLDDFNTRLEQIMNQGATTDEKRQNGLDFIKQNGMFGLTWDGFFLKSERDDGARVEISTDNDIQVLTKYQNIDVERIKIGQLDDGTYGIKISDVEGAPVLKTNDTGSLWLTKEIIIGPSELLTNQGKFYNARARLGVIDTYGPGETGPLDSYRVQKPYSLIFSVTPQDSTLESIAIYDDGTLVANNARIKGHIEATSGKIGNLSIESFASNLSGIEVISSNGLTIKEATNGTLSPANFSFKPKVTGMIEPITISWTYSKTGNISDYIFYTTTLIGEDWDDDGNLVKGDGTLTISSTELYSMFNTDGITYIKATVTQNGIQYETVIVLTLLKDAELDAGDIDLDIYNITLSYPEFLKYYLDDGSLDFTPGFIDLITYKGQEDDVALARTELSYDIYLYSEQVNKYNSEDNKWFQLNKEYQDAEYFLNNDGEETLGDLSTYSNIFADYITFISNTECRLNIEQFIADSLLIDNKNKYFYREVSRILKNENTSIKINAKTIEKGLIASINCGIKFGTAEDMASFRLTATNIQMAVQSTGLTFDSEGLHIINGGFDIYNQTEEIQEDDTLIVIKEDLLRITDGQLVLQGTGTFTGDIYANNGYFNGTVNALDGSLGNLSVNGLLSLGNNLVINGLATETNPIVGFYSKNYTENGNEGFAIKQDGSIIANNLTLGSGANIAKYVRLGKAWLINPEWLNLELAKTNPDTIVTDNNLSLDSVFLVKDNNSQDLINIRQDGILTVGNTGQILINGNNGSISSGNYSDNNRGWSITPEEAEFNNITARGSIKAVAFEYEQNSVQSIGGIMLVKPSSAINKISMSDISSLDGTTEVYIITETSINLNEGEYIKIGHSSTGDILFTGRKDTEAPNKLILNFDSSLLSSLVLDDLVGAPVINMGNINSASIVINGTDSDSTYPKSSLSIFENNIYQDIDKTYSTLHPETKLVLGQMPTSVINKTYGIFNATSYGLYAENVFVKGAIISEGKNKINEFMYSGMNTNSTVEFNEEDKVYFDDPGYIILWAGAQQKKTTDGLNITNTIDIQNAKFKVDNNGNLYANSGYFVGTIITDATITASKIKTAEIEGYTYRDAEGNIIDKAAALTIKNSDIGIKFVGNNNNEVMVLDTNGITLNASLNVGNKFTVKTDSSLIVPITFFSDYQNGEEKITIATPNKIGFATVNSNPKTLLDYSSIIYTSYISNGTDGLSIYGENNTESASFNSSENKLKKNVRIGGQIMSFYDSNGNDKIQWKTVNLNGEIVGYDLYLT